jgi:hypothetical protein
MTIHRTAILVAILFALLATQTDAQSKSNPFEPMRRFLGYWDGPADFTMGEKSYHVTYCSEFRPTADGSGMYMDEWFTHPELGSMKGGNLIGYNPNDGHIHWMSVDNMGTAHTHLGDWKSPDHFFMSATETVDGRQSVEDIDCVFTSADEMNFHIVTTVDGKVTQEGKATFHRKQKPKSGKR